MDVVVVVIEFIDKMDLREKYADAIVGCGSLIGFSPPKNKRDVFLDANITLIDEILAGKIGEDKVGISIQET